MRKINFYFLFLFCFFLSCGKEGQFQKDHITKLNVKKRQLEETKKNKKEEDKLFKFEIFSDFKCPACISYWSNIYNLKKKYEKNVKFVFNYYPLSYHKESLKTSIASICAKEQDKEWEYINEIYTNEITTDKALLLYAQNLSLDIEKFKICYNSQNTKKIITKIKELAKKRNVFDVPTVFVNKKRFKGARPIDFLENEIEKEIEKTDTKSNKSNKTKDNKKEIKNKKDLEKEVDKIQEDMKNNKEREELEKKLKESKKQ